MVFVFGARLASVGSVWSVNFKQDFVSLFQGRYKGVFVRMYYR